jgi:hypothetical protein
VQTPVGDPVQAEFERIKRGDLFGALGLHWTDGASRIDEGIARMRKKWGPASTAAAKSPEWAARLLELAEAAYRELDTVAQRRTFRAEVLKVDARGAAELLTQQAKLDIRREDLVEARAKLTSAMELEPNNERRELMTRLQRA